MNFRKILAAKSRERRVYTPEQIASLKADLDAGMGANDAARKHDLPRWIVRDVIDRKSWRDVPPSTDGPLEAA